MKQPGPCARRVVKATIVTPSGMQFEGTNHCLNAQPTCPRAHLPTGVGYEFCRDVCEQPGHAEIQALWNASLAQPHLHLSGSICYIEGHTYVCENCNKALFEAGVGQVVFAKPPTVQ